MNYISLINRFWSKDIEFNFSDRETAFYFYLLKVSNSIGWKNPFGLSNSMIITKFNWGKTSFDTAKNRLKAAGLIDFKSGLGRGNLYQYYIIKDDEEDAEEEEKRDAEKERERENKKGVDSATFSGDFHEIPEKGAQKNTFDTHFSDTLSNTFSDTFSETYLYSINIKKKENKNNSMVNIVELEKEVVELFNATCVSFPKVIRLTEKRSVKIRSRIKEISDFSMLAVVFEKMQNSNFLKGQNQTGWKATFDWVFENEENMLKVFEGNYDNNEFRNDADDRFSGKLNTDVNKF